MKTFFTSYIGLFKRHAKMNEQNVVQGFIGLAYEVLTGGDQSGHTVSEDRERKNTLETFKIETYKSGSNLFSGFQYWH
jgi:hypothetical protein